MEGNYNWKTNEQGRDSLANNANDWRSTHEPDLRKRVTMAIVEKLKICFPTNAQNDINDAAFKFEGQIYGMATDKIDYLRKITEKVMVFDKKIRSTVQSGSSVHGPKTSQNPEAHSLNQGQPLPTSLPYMQTPTSQQWFHQNNIHESSGFSNQVPITATAAQSLNIQMGEGLHSNLLTGSQRQTQGRQQFYSQPQQQPQNYNDMFQFQVDQQLMKENIHHLQPPYMQQHHQQSLLKQPIHQQLPHHTSLSTIHQSFPQSSSLSSLTSPGPQNSQFLPRHQFPTQRVHSNHQQQMDVLSHEQLISQLMNGQDMQQNHLTSQQNNREQQGAFTVSSSQQNNIASFQEMAQQNNNLQDMYQQQRLYSHSNNVSAFPSQQQQYMPGGQYGNFNVYESSLLGTQGQEVGQSQPMMLQQYQQNMILQQHLDDTQRFQATCSLHQTQNTGDQQNQPYQLQTAPPANTSTYQKVFASGEDWQEETYQKIKALKENYLPLLSTLLQKVSDKLQKVDSLPQQKMQYESIQKLRTGKSTLEAVIMYLNVSRDSISKSHRDMFSLYEEQVLRFTKNHQTMTQTSGHNPVHVSHSLDNDQMNISPAQTSVFHQKHFHHLQMQPQLVQSQQQQQPQTNLQQSLDFVAPYINSQTDSYKQFSSFESEADSTVSSGSKVQKVESGCALMQEIKDINGSLVETVVNICNEDVYPSEVTSGTVVTCCYTPVALSDTLEAHYKSGHIIRPLRLLVPVNYPYSPIIILEKLPFDASLHNYDDLSARTRSRFSLSMKEFSEPKSLKEIAQVWDVCARETMAEYCERHGGGPFSSKYGHWESVLGAS